MAGFTLVPGSGGGNYTGVLTKSIVFSGALIAFLAGKDNLSSLTRFVEMGVADKVLATGLTLASIIVPNWISFENHTVRSRPPKYPSSTGTDIV